MSTPGTAALVIRSLTNRIELDRCVEIQVSVWGYTDADVVPRRVFVLAQHIGGQLLGAFVEGSLAGFAMALPGYHDGRVYLHSHMLAVLPEHRNAGLGWKLKLAQRDDALERGFDLMEWTFDPLEIKNSYFNLARLGAVCRRYHADFYGPSSSPLQGGLPTDRLCAEWWLRSDRVRRALSGEPIHSTFTERLAISPAVHVWKRHAAERYRACELQARNRQALESAFSRGLAIVGYERGQDGSGAFLLGSTPPEMMSPAQHSTAQPASGGRTRQTAGSPSPQSTGAM